MEVRSDEVRLARPALRLVGQVPLSIPAANQRRSRADAPGRLEIAPVVADHPRSRKVAAELLFRAEQHPRLRLPALASLVGPVGAVVDPVEGGSRRFEKPLKIPVDTPQHLFREIAPTAPALVCY